MLELERFYRQKINRVRANTDSFDCFEYPRAKNLSQIVEDSLRISIKFSAEIGFDNSTE